MIALTTSKYIEDIRVAGDIVFTSTNKGGFMYGGAGAVSVLKFFELMGTSNAPFFYDNNTTLYSGGTIVHLGYDTVANGALPCTASQGRPAIIQAIIPLKLSPKTMA